MLNGDDKNLQEESALRVRHVLLVEDNPLFQEQITNAVLESCPGSKVTW